MILAPCWEGRMIGGARPEIGGRRKFTDCDPFVKRQAGAAPSSFSDAHLRRADSGHVGLSRSP